MTMPGRQLWGRAGDLLKLIHRAQQDGVDVIADMMTYHTTGVWWAPRAILPAWAYDWENDSWSDAVAKIRAIVDDPAARGQLIEEIEARRSETKTAYDAKMVFSDWSRIFLEEVSPGSSRSEHLGRSMAEIAEMEGRAPAELYLELIVQEGSNLSTVRMNQHEDDYYELVKDPYIALGCTDSLGLSPDLLDHPLFRAIQFHPRHFGAFPRVLEKYVRQEGVLSLEEAVRRMTSLPAAAVGLLDRGTIARGKWADLVVFDPYKIGERGTFRKPVAFPKGINYVIVNGQVAVEDGSFTNTFAGRIL
jgi:N-acyl-D-aspartate/D-glutamate deacylase